MPTTTLLEREMQVLCLFQKIENSMVKAKIISPTDISKKYFKMSIPPPTHTAHCFVFFEKKNTVLSVKK